MKKHLFNGAFLLGAMAVVWVGTGFIGSHLLALTMTLLIAAVYVFGALELRQYGRATATLSSALAAIPEQLASLGDWLDGVHASLQNPVRLRIEGERIGLPGPVLTPYLVGLLVMLGMLGTFLGMVVTLNGAAFSLESTTDLQAIRAALAAPIKGLGLAFGTSVAGVATSAMLGLMSALSRGDRLRASQLLDSKLATSLRSFSLTHQRQETYKALQYQAQALPEVVDKLQTMMTQMAHMSQQLNTQLTSNQTSFHSEVKGIYSELASSVGQSLKDSLAQSAHVASDSLKPMVETAMTGMAQEARLLHTRLIDTAQTQLDGLAASLAVTAATVTDNWTAALASHERSSASMVSGVGQSLSGFADTFEQRATSLLTSINQAYATLQVDQAALDQQRQQAWIGSLDAMAANLQQEWQQAGAQTLAQQQHICSTLVDTAHGITEQAKLSASATLSDISRLVTASETQGYSRIAAEADWLTQHGERMDQLASLLRSELGALRDDEAQRGLAAVNRLGDLQAAMVGHLATLGTALEAPITRLIATASEAPRAAAEVIGQLRQEMSGSLVRDNELLEERSRIMATLNSLLEAIHHAAAEQRAVIDTLVASSAVALNTVSSQFADQLGVETGKLADVAAHVNSSAVEVSSLGETFGFAVQSFGAANEKLLSQLQRIEVAMDKSMTRSDEQLAYYVAQARELIDLSTLSQKEIFEELRQLPRQQALSAQEVN
ncbi:MAG: DUF802 domain-containing protein [Rhodoferax sp.]|uniref:DUF802 domain-containing protein n=1 Tax=Rhodoferax sp. TaxID=50421 RepID=UPI00261183AD|nr:DUF802 domain-containing protein [Rhodoferax sp.]MDD2880729.1 DUF802 domain-containing protein [Rhodoferax sp.]